MLALAHQRGHAKQQFRPLIRRHMAPRLKSLVSSFNGAAGQFFRRLMKFADDLGAIRGIDTLERIAGLNALAPDHQRVFLAELLFYFSNGTRIAAAFSSLL